MKKLSLLFTVFLFAISIPITVLAHPGSTDGNGGHYDRSTGEYHYHHGYSAHDHYDMDGDGIDDCPYNYDDKTNTDIGSPSTASYSSRYSSNYDNEPPETITVYEELEIIKEVPVVPTWIKWLWGCLSVLILCLLVSNHWKKQEISHLQKAIDKQAKDAREQNECHKTELRKKDEDFHKQISDLKTKHSEQLKKTKLDMQETIEQLKSDNVKLRNELGSVISTIPIGEVYYPDTAEVSRLLYRISIPSDVYFIDGKIPVKGRVNEYDPLGDYTVFVGKSSSVYHSFKYCGSAYDLKPVHVFDVMGKLRPCRKCGKEYGNEPPKWYTELVALQEKTKSQHKP